jgi:hypothetical protein
MRVVFDVETDALINPTTIHCIVAKDLDTQEISKFYGEGLATFPNYHSKVTEYVGHNILSFDVPVLWLLMGLSCDDKKLTDTLVLSRLLKYGIDGGHSLEAWGNRLGIQKKGLDVSFSEFSQELLDRCISDVEINYKLYLLLKKKLIDRKDFDKAIEVEHAVAKICLGMKADGFKFDLDKATSIHKTLDTRIAELDAELLSAFPSKAKLHRVVTPKETVHGTISRVGFPRDWDDLTTVSVGCPFSLVTWEPFNPASPPQIVERLNRFGWSPTDKTKGHQDAVASKNKEALAKFKETGWKVNETNLSSLPDSAPQAAHSLVERLLLDGRRRSITEWINNCRIKIKIKETHSQESGAKEIEVRQPGTRAAQENLKEEQQTLKENTELLLTTIAECLQNKDIAVKFVSEKPNSSSIIVTPQGRFVDFSVSDVIQVSDGSKNVISQLSNTCKVHGTFNGIGTWSHRLSHTHPNLGNVAAPKSIKYKHPKLADLATLLGKEMRSLWTVSNRDWWLVGTDAVGIQLRIFAHYINDEGFTHAVTQGTSKNGDDPHTLNSKLLGCNRDTAKTFIYAFLLGAGDAKMAEILGLNKRGGREARTAFIESYPGLARLRKDIIPADARRGYFKSFDGRLVVCESEHLMMAGYLQTGEACVMKTANVLWRKELDREQSRYIQRNFVHDEWQTESCSSDRRDAERIGEVQRRSIRTAGESFNLRCPMDGDTRIGKNWYDTH